MCDMLLRALITRHVTYLQQDMMRNAENDFSLQIEASLGRIKIRYIVREAPSARDLLNGKQGEHHKRAFR